MHFLDITYNELKSSARGKNISELKATSLSKNIFAEENFLIFKGEMSLIFFLKIADWFILFSIICFINTHKKRSFCYRYLLHTCMPHICMHICISTFFSITTERI